MQENGKWTAEPMVAFFSQQGTNGFSINQSAISDILSKNFKHLDEEDYFLHSDSRKQRRAN